MTKLGLAETEIENIFDILEKPTPIYRTFLFVDTIYY